MHYLTRDQETKDNTLEAMTNKFPASISQVSDHNSLFVIYIQYNCFNKQADTMDLHCCANDTLSTESLDLASAMFHEFVT